MFAGTVIGAAVRLAGSNTARPVKRQDDIPDDPEETPINPTGRGVTVPDPIFGAIEAHRKADADMVAVEDAPERDDARLEAAYEADRVAFLGLLKAWPTTEPGRIALARYGCEMQEDITHEEPGKIPYRRPAHRILSKFAATHDPLFAAKERQRLEALKAAEPIYAAIEAHRELRPSSPRTFLF